MTALGVADVNGVYGLPRAYEVVRDHAPGLKLICGAEITVKDRPPLQLLVQTREAWGFLCRLITQVHAGKEKGQGSIEYEEIDFLARRFKGAKGIVCIARPDAANDFEFLKTHFKDRLYISICRYLDGSDRKRTKAAIELSEQFRLPLVATNDVHYHSYDRRPLQDCLTCIREGTTLDKAGFHLFGNEERFLKSPEEMQNLFSDLPDAIENTVRIADSCTFSLSELKYTYPKESVPEGYTTESYLRELVMTGALKRYKGVLSEEAIRQINRELNFFHKRNEEDYFLTIYDILRDAREKKIVFQGRGSAANSIVCYALGITAIDPIKEKLLFDRFANDARKDPPDIDVDFEHERREEVIQSIYSRYGRDRAAMVAAVHTYQRDGAFRELCKVIGVDVGTKKAAVIRDEFEALAKEYAFRGIFLDRLMSEISGFPRHLGTHSGGFVITNEPLVESVPIEPAAMDGRTIVQFDKHDLETLGMMKVDILSIGFLTVIRKATALIGMNWEDIPGDDAKTYSLIQRAETAGCFQIESRAQMSSLPHTQPKTAYEMTIQVALIRPSMSVGGMNRAYLSQRKKFYQTGKRFSCGNAAMDSILERTHGVAMFPEQIMQIAMDVCGLTSRQADELRRSLGRERSADSVDSQGEKLYHSMIAAGINAKLAEDIMKRTQGFASYGFPEAHAASYGSLAYKSAYLKAHHPAEYLCGMINSQPMGFYRIDFLINEAVRNSGITVLPVHPNKSDWDAIMEGPKRIRMGFRNISKMREDDVLELMKIRAVRKFQSIEDFIARTGFDKAVIQNLALSDAFVDFGIDRRHSFWKSIEFRNLVATEKSQTSFFDENFCLDETLPLFQQMTALEEAVIDYRILGYSLKGSLMKQLRLAEPHLPSFHSQILKKAKRNTVVRCAGILLVDQRPPPAKGFGFITLEDEFGTIDLILPPDVYDTFKPVFRASRFLIAEGVVQRLGDQVTIKVKTIESFAQRQIVRSHQPTPRMLDRLTW